MNNYMEILKVTVIIVNINDINIFTLHSYHGKYKKINTFYEFMIYKDKY